MSKTQLQTNNTRLTSLITELQGKAAGSSGGASVETCTLTCTTTLVTELCYQSTLGEVKHWIVEEPGDVLGSDEILCGSLIYGPSSLKVIAVNASSVRSGLWLVTAPAGGTVSFIAKEAGEYA